MKARPNPGELLVFGANPDGSTAGATAFGRVHRIEYVHDTEGPRFHDFDGREVIEGLPDGSLRVYHPGGGDLWAAF